MVFVNIPETECEHKYDKTEIIPALINKVDVTLYICPHCYIEVINDPLLWKEIEWAKEGK